MLGEVLVSYYEGDYKFKINEEIHDFFFCFFEKATHKCLGGKQSGEAKALF